ncbi:hypothetical protein QZM46_29885, partial [Burkholderia vietnamiensis]|uniref:hypothetical protein n=1 Tax=Burkholderia vietnamiensis TaxID=60552 RepID=UPI00264BACFC
MDCSFQPTCFDNEAPNHPLETVSKRPRGAVNFRGELLTSGIGTTETEEMAKPIIDDELWT